jgi:hypothetical protein
VDFYQESTDQPHLWWVRMQNIITQMPSTEGIEIEPMCKTYLDTSVSPAQQVNWKARILPSGRTDVCRAIDLTVDQWTDHPSLCREAFFYLWIRSMCNPPVGDSGLWNLLVRTSDWTLWMIDYEEQNQTMDCGTPVTKDNWSGLFANRPLRPIDAACFKTLLGLEDRESLAFHQVVDQWSVYAAHIETLSQAQPRSFDQAQINRLRVFLNIV